MPYVSELGTGQLVYLDNQNEQTIFTIVAQSPGQQQQATNSFTTGIWTAEPEILQTSTGVIVKIHTSQGEQIIQIQGNSTSMTRVAPKDAKVLPIEQVNNMPQMTMNMSPMKPLEPMKPMKMEGMTMKMGNMEMSMGNRNSTVKRFCPSCGAAVNPDDRFCSSCGYNLGG